MKFSTERRAEAGTECDLLNFTPPLSQNDVTNARTFLRFCAIVAKVRQLKGLRLRKNRQIHQAYHHFSAQRLNLEVVEGVVPSLLVLLLVQFRVMKRRNYQLDVSQRARPAPRVHVVVGFPITVAGQE